jgi:hypothetical protein
VRTLLEPLGDPGRFRQVSVDDGSLTIMWPNGLDPDPDPELLHGDFERRPRQPEPSWLSGCAGEGATQSSGATAVPLTLVTLRSRCKARSAAGWRAVSQRWLPSRTRGSANASPAARHRYAIDGKNSRSRHQHRYESLDACRYHIAFVARVVLGWMLALHSKPGRATLDNVGGDHTAEPVANHVRECARGRVRRPGAGAPRARLLHAR